jgi:hypothetical protein
MNNFEYITPEQAHAIDDSKSVAQYRKQAQNTSRCIICGAPAWRFVDLDMCFPCTTGETDASQDYELIQE